MDSWYRSTRGAKEIVKSSAAILRGLASDGGLYVPDQIPGLGRSMKDYAQMDYRAVAKHILSLFLTDYTEEELEACVSSAYDEKFDTPAISPITCANGDYFLELYHGPTMAFKDMALSILPYLMVLASKKNNENKKTVILTATSGDTGKAALEGFKDVKGTEIIVFYPKHGVSPIQEKQMISQQGKNVHVIGIEGNFDDAQSGVKAMFTNSALKKEMADKGYVFSSANSINIGRLIPQIAYYVYAYAQMLKAGDIGNGYKINICVPTGNFGNILAAYYASFMGLPVKKLICASNSNRVLYDFFRTGIYDKNRPFILTESPSMDILLSSNLERLIYHIGGDNSDKNVALMAALGREGRYEISHDMKSRIEQFHGGYADEEDCAEAIKSLFKESDYLIDTHTSVAYAVHQKYMKKTGDDTATLIASTASPYKFTSAVLNALEGRDMSERSRTANDFELARRLSKITGTVLPVQLEELENAKILHDTVCSIENMEAEVRKILGI